MGFLDSIVKGFETLNKVTSLVDDCAKIGIEARNLYHETKAEHTEEEDIRIPRGASCVYFYDESMTGRPNEVLNQLRRRISAYSRSDSNVKKLYIGIASGKDAIRAMKRRDDFYKMTEGINEMIALYESSSQKNCRCVESELVDYFAYHSKNINRSGGGGGRYSYGPNYYVYLAIRRWG